MTLDQMSAGNDFVISAVRAAGETRRRLVDMGFVSGARGTLLRRAALGGPVEIRLGTFLVAVRCAEAGAIEVTLPHGCN